MKNLFSTVFNGNQGNAKANGVKTQANESTSKTTMLTNNPFVLGALGQKTTRSENGAMKLATSGSNFVDQFNAAAIYFQGKRSKGKEATRTQDQINVDMSTLWGQDPEMAVRFALYLRAVTRKTKFRGVETEKAQTGQGLKQEGIGRFYWLGVNHPATFKANLDLLVSVGSFNDVIQLMEMDLLLNGVGGCLLDWDFLGSFVATALVSDAHSSLMKKYLPLEVSMAKIQKEYQDRPTCAAAQRAVARNLVAKFLRKRLFDGSDVGKAARLMRKLKASGTAHSWQQAISRKNFQAINFNLVAGRALKELFTDEFISKHGLEAAFDAFVASKPTVKFTGYPYELTLAMKKSKSSAVMMRKMYDKQFMGLVEKGKTLTNGIKNPFIVVRDTSGSMGSSVRGAKDNASCDDVAQGMALYFSYLLEGVFANSWIEFDDDAQLHLWNGNTPSEKIRNDASSVVGSTDFQSVIKLFVKLKQSGIAEDDFPKGIICITDSEFNVARNPKGYATNFQTALDTLRKGGFSEEFVSNFKIVLWELSRDGKEKATFEGLANTENLFHISGLDGASIAFLFGREVVQEDGQVVRTNAPKNSDELFLEAMNQEVLNAVEVLD